MKPVIAITMGDPVGIGPEIVLRALASRRVRRVARPLVLGDMELLKHIACRLDLVPPRPAEIINMSTLSPKGLRPGRPTKESSGAMLEYIEEAVCMAEKGDCDAVVTAPINKEAASLVGFRFPGHTEFMAHLTKTKDYVMMLGGKALKVVLVTIHEPLRRVPGLISTERILKTIRITDRAFRGYFGVRRPRIAVCGLNPHAGEAGLFGREEEEIIGPAVKKARAAGINAAGPLPPDTVFHRTVKGREFDGVVCMYHDQGLIPLKLLHFEDAVNVTLGLPIIRTSVDHGTAYNIAWKGEASAKSLVAAIETAAEMARRGMARTERKRGRATRSRG